MNINPYIRIAVISDLHCQKEENSSKLTRLHTKLLDHPVNENPVESLKKIIIKEQKHVDYFLVLGDVTDKGNVEGFVLGVKFIKELNTLLNAEKLIFAIGNHDMYRRKKDDIRQDSEYMMKRTNGFPFSFKNETTEEIDKEFWANKYCIIEDEKAIFLVLNTSCFMGNEDSLKSIVFDPSMSEKIHSSLDKYKSSNKIKIAVCHHHPNQHSDMNATYTSLDCIDQGDKLIELLKKHNFTILMHGHKHFPRLKHDDNLPVFCSGSFSSLENTLSFNEDNTTHFINIFQDEFNYKGVIETWVYNYSNGWEKSTNLRSRFPVYTGFGSTVNACNLANDIYKFFYPKPEDENSIQQYIPIDIEDVIKQFSEVAFLTPIQQQEFEEELGKHNVILSMDKRGKRTFRKEKI